MQNRDQYQLNFWFLLGVEIENERSTYWLSLRLLITHTILRNVTVICQERKEKIHNARYRISATVLEKYTSPISIVNFFRNVLIFIERNAYKDIPTDVFVFNLNKQFQIFTQELLFKILNNASDNFDNVKYSCEYCCL